MLPPPTHPASSGPSCLDRKDSDFLYLTGFDEAQAFLILETDDHSELIHSSLIVQPKVPACAPWPRACDAGAALASFSC